MKTRREKLRERAEPLWEASALDSALWFVGRTDIQSHTEDGLPEHYAYNRQAKIRIRFTSFDGDEALEQAINFCEWRNTHDELVDVVPLDFTVRGKSLPNSQRDSPADAG